MDEKQGGSEFVVFCGVDWATQAHQVCVLDAQRSAVEQRTVAHDGEALRALAEWLIGLAGGVAEQVAVGIEVPHGAVVETSLESGVAVFAINPKQLDRLRDRHTVAGAKDDRLDAAVLGHEIAHVLEPRGGHGGGRAPERCPRRTWPGPSRQTRRAPGRSHARAIAATTKPSPSGKCRAWSTSR